MADAFEPRREFSLRVQKMILSRMASNDSTRKIVIDDATAGLLDNLYQIIHLYTSSKQDSGKLVKNIIKLVVKVDVLYRNNELTVGDLECIDKFKAKFHSVAMTVLSFHGVEYVYDRQFMISLLQEAHSNLRQVVQNHLKQKSVQRLDSVFSFFTEPDFLDALFKRESKYQEILDKAVQDISTALDEKRL